MSKQIVKEVDLKDPDFFENVLIKFLFVDAEVREKVMPYINPALFHKKNNKVIIETIFKYVDEYEAFPSANEVFTELDDEDVFDHLTDTLNMQLSEFRKDYLLNEIEVFIQKKSIANVVTDLMSTLDSDEWRKIDSVDQLRESFAFSFDSSVGMDIFSSEDRMYDFFHEEKNFVPTDIKNLDRLIQGGFHTKTLNLFMAGCVDKSTPVKIRIGDVTKKVKVKSVEKLLKKCDQVLVDSPDGFVKVKAYIKKGVKPSYRVVSGNRFVVASYDHLFETDKGWVFTEMLNPKIHKILTDIGYEDFGIEYVGNCDVVDLDVDSPRHRYYTNGLSSHNTNVGKSLVMASLAVNNIYRNKKVLYISGEMSEEKISERVLANTFDVPISELSKVNRERFHELFENFSQYKEKFILKEYPPKKFNANHIRNLLKELKLKKKFVPDIIYVDYLALMASVNGGKNKTSYEILKDVSEELRAVSVEFEIPIVSAVQVGRDGINSTDIDLDDISESIGITFTADVMIAMTQSPEMLAAGKYCWTIVKNRYGAKKLFITVCVDFEKMRVSYDVENDEYGYATPDGSNPNPDTKKQKDDKEKKKKDDIGNFMKKKEETKSKFFDYE